MNNSLINTQPDFKCPRNRNLRNYLPDHLSRGSASLRASVNDALRRIYPAEYLGEAARLRVEQEMTRIGDTDLVSHYLILHDLAKWMRQQGIGFNLYGSGRNSIIAYALDISPADPLDEGLYFECFYPPESEAWPEFRLEVEHVRKKEVLQYLKNLLGVDKIAITGPLYNNNLLILLGDGIEEVPLKRAMDGEVLVDISSFELRSKGFFVFQLNGEPHISLLHQCLREVQKKKLFNLEDICMDICLNDTPTWRRFAKGEVKDVYQLTSQSAHYAYLLLKPKSLMELSNLIALHRPGTDHIINLYSSRANQDDCGIHLPWDVEVIARRTRGIVIYKEQFIQILCNIYDVGSIEAATWHRLLSNATPEILHQERQKFEQKISALHDWNENAVKAVADSLFMVLPSPGHFSKSVSLTCAETCYRLAYFKENYNHIYEESRSFLHKISLLRHPVRF